MPESSSTVAPRVSVLMPTRNYARFLPAAILSVLRQRYPNFELLVSDDGSDDESAEVIRTLAEGEPRVRWVRHDPALGMVANWNWCLREARGDYIQFVFGDDLLAAPDALTRLVAALDAHPRAALAASPRLLVDECGDATGEWNELRPGLHAGPALVARCLRLRRNLVGEPSTVMFRRHLARRGFDPDLRQIVDLEFWFHLLAQGDAVALPLPYCAFRRHAAQATHRHNAAGVSDREYLTLLDRYTAHERIRPHLPPDSWRYRFTVYRQMHYLAKRGMLGPVSCDALADLRTRLPGATRWACWAWHRLARPLENLSRHLRAAWSRLRPSTPRHARRHAAAQQAFLAALPRPITATSHAPERATHPSRRRMPRWIGPVTATLGAAGFASATGLLLLVEVPEANSTPGPVRAPAAAVATALPTDPAPAAALNASPRMTPPRPYFRPPPPRHGPPRFPPHGPPPPPPRSFTRGDQWI